MHLGSIWSGSDRELVVQGDHLLLCLSGPSDPEAAMANPLAAANDLDILTLVSMIKGEWQQAFGA